MGGTNRSWWDAGEEPNATGVPIPESGHDVSSPDDGDRAGDDAGNGDHGDLRWRRGTGARSVVAHLLAVDRDAARPLDRALDALGHPYRRRVLALVSECEVGISIDPVAAADDTARLVAELHHTHLPKLDDVGYVEWDEASRTIRPGPAFDEIEPVLRLLGEDGRPRDRC